MPAVARRKPRHRVDLQVGPSKSRPLLDFDVSMPFFRDEERRLLSRIAMYLAILVECYLWYLPSERRVAARSIPLGDPFANERGRPALPREAIFVGLYSHPLPARHVLEDLVEALRRR